MVENSDDEIMKGSIVFCNHGTAKMAKFRIILRKWLGINDIDIHLVVRRHRFATEVPQYCTQEGKNITTPIPKKKVVELGLKNVVEIFGKDPLVFVANNTFDNVEFFLSTNNPARSSRLKKQLEHRTVVNQKFTDTKDELTQIDDDIYQIIDDLNNRAGKLKALMQRPKNYMSVLCFRMIF